ncbi:formate/nitrite transporter [Polymorphobacter multimanifer]|uniref:Formate/nitrite transporter n=1 Tax=Polymorphobacter multimanifer TaxID=1070431 RepID=A0A841L0G7_9SPHN|nr:formate/nitrite transporter family protein [Polymorphobacter multimanifer]MBB6226319.1 formate/nitrite transporter [Polymorphobacter multimanifer]
MPADAAVDVVEVRPPDEIATEACAKGTTKAELDFGTLAVLALLAGVYISFGGLFAIVSLAGSDGTMAFGAAQFVAGLGFSLGLILVIVGGAELFTGNTLLIIALAEGKVGFGALLRALGLAYVFNLVGSLSIAALALMAGAHVAGDGAVGIAALEMADAKVRLAFGPALASGILANMLVCLAVWLAFGARSAADKVLVMILPIAAFVAAGLEHSIANMFIIPFGWMVQQFADAGFWATAGASAGDYAAVTLASFLGNLLPVTIGNIIGGFAVGGAYWFAYLRKRPGTATD